MQKYCLVLFGTLNTEWKWKWIMNVYRQDCSKFENLEKWPCCCCLISIRPWSPLELLTELTKRYHCPNCPDFNSAEFAANSWPTVDLRLNNESSSNFWPSKTSTLPSPPARGAPHPPCASFRFIFILHRPDGTCKHRSALNVTFYEPSSSVVENISFFLRIQE